MAHERMPELHVTGLNVEAGVRRSGLGGKIGPVPLVALEIEGRPCLDAAD